jgi:hypothetical protein
VHRGLIARLPGQAGRKREQFFLDGEFAPWAEVAGIEECDVEVPRQEGDASVERIPDCVSESAGAEKPIGCRHIARDLERGLQMVALTDDASEAPGRAAF